MKRKILFVSGTRADYGKLKPLAQAAQRLGNHVGFWVTGMHVLEDFGLTKLEITKDGYDTVDEYINQKPDDLQSIIIAKTITTFTDFLIEKRPDLVVIHGDRLEALACAISASANYIKVLHIEGGEVSGTIDEIFRHAISKLSNIHCVSSQRAKERLISMGENPENIHHIGSPELDVHLNCDASTIDAAKQHYCIDFDEYGIAIFHPVTSEASTIRYQAELFFKALVNTKKNFLVIKPNNDPGSDSVNRIIAGLPKKRFHVLPSIRFEYFSVLLQNCSALVGNSSAGVREAPFLGIPSLNIGTRQSGRSQCTSITNCPADETSKIQDFFSTDWGKSMPRDISFGDGRTVDRFTKIISNDDTFEKVTQKLFFDRP